MGTGELLGRPLEEVSREEKVGGGGGWWRGKEEEGGVRKTNI